MNKYILPVIVLVITFGSGFFCGGEYKAYQIRTMLNTSFEKTLGPKNGDYDVIQKAQKGVMIMKNMGDEVELSTIRIKAISADEKKIINRSYGQPLVAKKLAKFVEVNVELTNTTKATFNFSPSIYLVDNLDRQFEPNTDIGSSDGSLNYVDLSPSITQTGNLLYEVPENAIGYGLLIGKAGTDNWYKIVLK